MRKALISLLWRVAILPTDRDFRTPVGRVLTRFAVSKADKARVWLSEGQQNAIDDFDPEGEV